MFKSAVTRLLAVSVFFGSDACGHPPESADEGSGPDPILATQVGEVSDPPWTVDFG